MGKDDPPQPPAPSVTAGSQTSTNVSTAVANAFLNNMNQNTPLGTLKYDVTSTFDWQDPVTGAVYSVPRFTVNQQLPPIQQETQNQTEQAKRNLAQLANTQSSVLNQVLGAGVDISQAPARGTLPPSIIDPQDLSMYGPVQTSFGDAGAITRDYDPGGTTQRDRVEAALNQRLDPSLAIERQRTEQQLADQGIRPGSPAYTAMMDNYQRQVTDARLGVIARGGEEQKLQNDIAAQRAGFQNAAQQQLFQQLQQRGQFANLAQQQGFTEAQQRAQFYNAAARQHYFEDPNTARQQYLTEQYAAHNQRINQLSALLSGSQVQQPNFMETPRTQIPTTDIAGITNANMQQQLAIWQQNQQSQNQLIGGVLGAVGNVGRGLFSGGFLSDERAKENKHRVGSIFVAEPQEVAEPDKRELPIYQYSYKGDPTKQRHIGPMAQDVEEIDPAAVRSIGGLKHVSGPRLMGAILRA